MQSLQKTIIAIVGTIAVCVTCVGIWLAFTPTTPASPSQESTKNISNPTQETEETQETQNEEQKETGEESAVSGAPDNVKLGFNNAEQIVATEEGSLMTWVSEGALSLVVRDSEGAAISTKQIAKGILRYPAIARTGNLIAIGWISGTGNATEVFVTVSSDDGKTFGEAHSLGKGNGISLSANNGAIVAAWHIENSENSGSINFSAYNQSWSTPVRVDSSTAAPKWTSIDIVKEKVFVTWRDDREGEYSIWLRRSEDGGKTWLDEQHLVKEKSGDPDVCATESGIVWIGHHGKGNITLLRSEDNGATFETVKILGSGSFAHLSCSEKAVAISWEDRQSGGAMTTNKLAGWAVYSNTAQYIDGGTLGTPTSAAATAFLTADPNLLEILWVKVADESDPLTGTLMHSFITIP